VKKKIDILMKNLLESKEKEELYYNKQIHFLELELEYLQKQYDE